MRKIRQFIGKIFKLAFWEDLLIAILRPLALLVLRPKYVGRLIFRTGLGMVRHPISCGIRPFAYRMSKLARWFWRTWPRRALAMVLILVLLSPFYLLFFAPKTEAAWWDDMWRYRKKLTIDKDQVAGELQNFPVLVSLTDTDLAAAAQSNGNDIAFTDAAGHKYSHEIESYTSATGVLVAWVKIPQLTNSHDTDIYMYYGNATCQSQQNPTDVWDDNFKMVQHMHQDPSGAAPQMLDSSENNNDGTSGGTMTSGDLVDAKIGKGLDFDGGDDYVDEGNINLGFTDKITINAWVRTDPNSFGAIVTKHGGGEYGWDLQRANNTFSWQLSTDGTNWNGGTTSTDSYLSGQWYYVSAVYDGSNMRVYINGSENTGGGSSFPTSLTGNINNAPAPLYIGGNYYQGISSGYVFDGLMDEVRISDVSRSSEWIETEYNNQNNPSAFLSVNSSQQERPGLPVGYWPFNEGYGTTTHDESGGGNDGTITGAQWQQESECISGKCLKFDGSGDEVDVGDVSY